MFKTKSKLNVLVEKNKDLDLAYVSDRLEKYDELVKYYSILHTKQHMDDTNVKFNEWWELQNFSSMKRCRKIWLHKEGMRLPIKNIYLPLKNLSRFYLSKFK
jgi:hypothetical protein